MKQFSAGVTQQNNLAQQALVSHILGAQASAAQVRPPAANQAHVPSTALTCGCGGETHVDVHGRGCCADSAAVAVLLAPLQGALNASLLQQLQHTPLGNGSSLTFQQVGATCGQAIHAGSTLRPIRPIPCMACAMQYRTALQQCMGTVQGGSARSTCVQHKH